MVTRYIVMILIALLWGCSRLTDKKPESATSNQPAPKYNKKSIDLNDQGATIYNQERKKKNPDTTQYEFAITLLDSAFKLDTSYVQALANKATVLTELGRPLEAIRALEIVTDKTIDNPSSTLGLGLIYDCLGKHAEANFYYRTSLKITQERYRKTKERTRRQDEIVLYLLLGDNAKADSLLRNLRKEFPTEESAVRLFENAIASFNKEELVGSYCK